MKVREIISEDIEGQKQKRFEFLFKLYEPKWHPVDGYDDLKKFLEKIAEIDPSRNGAYMQWISRMIIKDPRENKTEDLERLKGDLENFEKYKSQLEVKDINAYKSFHQLYDAIAPFLSKPKSKKEQEEEAIEKTKAQDIIDVYSGPDGWIKIPTSKKAAIILGQNTRWCTAASSSHNYFDHYNNTDRLIVIYDKKTKDRWQLHINSGQFADVTDRSHDPSTVPAWSRKPIIDWYKKNNPKLSLKHAITFANKWGVEDAAKDTEHAEILELFKKYGV